ncbi:hypothetical protein FOA52_015573 [Chlamydomonas sp. UWO 241]|nr:hypothetical protein FOA52_015573 [Chlamydomonas sp. UWO 241]
MDLGSHWWIYCFKVVPCTKSASHKWTLCPCGHPGETARRRDRRTHPHKAVLCPMAKLKKPCPLGDTCNWAHNVFELWLHPARYKTRLCSFGASCRRPICFFAHSSDELRSMLPGSCSDAKEDVERAEYVSKLRAAQAAGLLPPGPLPHHTMVLVGGQGTGGAQGNGHGGAAAASAAHAPGASGLKRAASLQPGLPASVAHHGLHAQHAQHATLVSVSGLVRASSVDYHHGVLAASAAAHHGHQASSASGLAKAAGTTTQRLEFHHPGGAYAHHAHQMHHPCGHAAHAAAAHDGGGAQAQAYGHPPHQPHHPFGHAAHSAAAHDSGSAQAQALLGIPARGFSRSVPPGGLDSTSLLLSSLSESFSGLSLAHCGNSNGSSLHDSFTDLSHLHGSNRQDSFAGSIPHSSSNVLDSFTDLSHIHGGNPHDLFAGLSLPHGGNGNGGNPHDSFAGLSLQPHGSHCGFDYDGAAAFASSASLPLPPPPPCFSDPGTMHHGLDAAVTAHRLTAASVSVASHGRSSSSACRALSRTHGGGGAPPPPPPPPPPRARALNCLSEDSGSGNSAHPSAGGLARSAPQLILEHPLAATAVADGGSGSGGPADATVELLLTQLREHGVVGSKQELVASLSQLLAHLLVN